MKIEQDIKLGFDDVLMVPKRSELPNRSPEFVNLKRKFHFKYSPIELSVTGIIAANMDTTGTFAMIKNT